MSKPKPDCPKCKTNKEVTEWVVKLKNNIWLCTNCTLTFDPDDPKVHKKSSKYQQLKCPICGDKLVHQPTIGENYRTATCYGKKLNQDGTISDTLKCGYKVTFKDGIVENQEWTGQKSKGKTSEG